MSCIGTAGHVDHGKSTLVTALTGMDPDRLAEEKARGMTIDLGFAWLTLPSGREASIVDVPGHESFIKNMLAGVGGIDVALLVIAADEGIMPQTSEHLAILDLLHVRTGVVALTKCDLVDDDWLDLVREEVSERIASTTLAGAPILACSSVTRAGLPELLAALDHALAVSEVRRDRARPRLPVDRVFTITGFGTVVTGTLQDGTLQVGQDVTLLPNGLRTRIRGLQTHKQTVEEGLPGSRIAVNLAGVARSDVTRGDVLVVPGTIRPTIALDARIEVLADAPRPIQHNAELELYVGAAEMSVRVVLLEGDEIAPGKQGWAQLRLRRPLVVARGDRFILRSPSPSITIGGGTVIEPWARRHRHGDGAVLARLDVLARGDPEDLVLAALRVDVGRAGTPIRRVSGYGGKDLAELVRLSELPESVITEALVELETRTQVVHAGATYFAASEWNHLQADATRLLATFHAQYPLRTGMPREEWRSRLSLSMREASDVLAALVRSGDIAEVGGPKAVEASSAPAQTGRGSFVTLTTHQPRLNAAQEQAVAAMLTRFRQAPFEPPTRQDVEADLGGEVVAALIERGTLVRISDSVLLEPEPLAEAQRRILSHLHKDGTITVAQARDLLATTRKYTLAIFEHLDERRITRRIGDDRVQGPLALQPAPPATPGA